MEMERDDKIQDELVSMWDSFMHDYDDDKANTLRTISLAAIAFALRDIRDYLCDNNNDVLE